MKGDPGKLYDSSIDFFTLEGNVVMTLTPIAAIGACKEAVKHRVIVVRIEGGIWHNPGFEHRYDCIWDGDDPPIDEDGAHQNNLLAVEFIESEMDIHDVFILTTAPITGYLHKIKREQQNQ